MSTFFRSVRFLAAVMAVLSATAVAGAFPGFYVGKAPGKRRANVAHVVLMMGRGRTAMTVMPDYKGPQDAFALVLAVPKDVEAEDVVSIKRDHVDRVNQLTAPRFHEFWEHDPCDSSKPEQEWERNLEVDPTKGGMFGPVPGATGKKTAKELRMDTSAEFNKTSEYSFTVLDADQSAKLGDWLKEKGYEVPEGLADKTKPVLDAGWKFLVAEVNTDKLEIGRGGRSRLSPIRVATEESIDTIPATLGLLSAGDKQELVLYVLHPEKRFEVKNYDNVFAPTNLLADLKAKERINELYAALHDLHLKKNPKAFLVEFAWSTTGCGEPCPGGDPLLISELMSLGGDVLEQAVSEEDKQPEPPEMDEKEKAVYDAMKPKEKKEYDANREKVTAVRALLKRQQYILTRLHHRYDAKTLEQDPKIGPADPVRGGVDVPAGEDGKLPLEVKTGAEENQMQTRIATLHHWKSVNKCDEPKGGRWGKSWPSYRGLRKIYVADETATVKRDEVDAKSLVFTAVPSLGLPGKASEKKPAEDAGAPAEGDGEKKDCGCSVPGRSAPLGPAAAAICAAGAIALLRRRRR